MPAPSLQELKKALTQAGFEVYRARGTEVQLAERPRDNLIMDANVSVVASEPLRVRLVVRAQKADFASDDDATLYQRALDLAAPAAARGYVEAERRARPLPDPGDPSRILDTWYEVVLERPADSVAEALGELPALLRLEKAATR